MSTLYLQIFRFKFDLKKWDNLKHAERPKVKGGSYTMGLQTANTPDENTPDFFNYYYNVTQPLTSHINVTTDLW